MRNLNEIFFGYADRASSGSILRYESGGRRVEYTKEQFHETVLSLALYFQDAGLRPGSGVAILSENRPEWHVADFAALIAGMASIPLYTAFAAPQLRYILEHSEAAVLVVSGPRTWEQVAALTPGLATLKRIVAMESWPGMPGSIEPLANIAAKGPPDPQRQRDLRNRALEVDSDSLATIVYTSGTTGVPKGVMLTHANLAFDLEQGLRRLEFRRPAQALSVLPLAHVFERLLCYGYFQQGVPIAYGDPHDLARLLPRYRPEVMGCVPRILEKIRENIRNEMARLRGPKGKVAAWLLSAGVACGGDGILGARRKRSIPGYLARAVVFRKIRAKLGGRLQYAVCGGSRLNDEVERFFYAVGIPVLQGYGLTETSPVITLTPVGAAKPGTVGKPLEDVKVAFTADGEIMVKGANVMKGYFKDPESTALAFQGGWLLTGDLGHLDADGYLVISGRKKEILVTAGGKNVHPAPVEEELAKIPFIGQVFLVGEGRPFIAALIVPEPEALAAELSAQGVRCVNLEEAMETEEVRNLYWREIENRQARFSTPERIKSFAFLSAGALEDPELVTPTQKLRRAAVEAKFHDAIEAMYDRAAKAKTAQSG